MSENNSGEIEARFNLVQRRYGDRFSAEEAKEVRETIEEIVRHSESLRTAHLENSDEPFSIFVPFRKEG